jgi:hypothetical protein
MYWETEVKLHAFLTSILDVSGQLLPWESTQYPLDRRLAGPQSWSGHSGEEKNLF